MQKINKKSEDIAKIIAWFDIFGRKLSEEEVISDKWLVVSKEDPISKKLWDKIDRYSPLFKKIPFVKMIAVCNTLAFGCPDENSDIDLFIITEKNRLFIARTILTILTTILGIRRHGNKVKGRFCLSFWITEQAMDFEKIQIPGGDPYLAFWAVTLKPLFGFETYKEFLEINKKWIEKTIPLTCHSGLLQNLTFNKVQDPGQARMTNKKFSILYSLFSILESLLRHYQVRRCKSKMQKLGPDSSNIVNENMLKFHNVDRRKFYKEEWEKRLIKYELMQEASMETKKDVQEANNDFDDYLEIVDKG